MTCTEVADSAPGFALDILEAETRARVAAHLIRCPGCRRTVTDMEESAAELLHPQPGSEWQEDPVGWPEETAWLDDRALPPVRPARRRLRMAVTMAAAATLFVGTTFGPELALRRGSQPIASGVLLAGNQIVGTVHFYAAGTPVIEVRADHLPASGKLGVVVTYSDGTASRIGDVEVSGGHAAWAGTEPVHSPGASSVVLVDSTLHEVAAASVR